MVYPRTLNQELKGLRERGLSYDNLWVAFNAHLITPAEIVLDRIKENVAGQNKIGSTGKGIGPAYSDFIARQGLIVNDLLNPIFLWPKLKRHLNYYRNILKNYDSDLIKEIMNHEHLESGLYYDDQRILDDEKIYFRYSEYGKEFKKFIFDTDSFIKSQLGIKNILVEGAQGDLLSVKFGTYPFVTSSDPSVWGLAEGIGLREANFDLSLGIIKGFYMTRVGGGPFPTELGGLNSERLCNKEGMNREQELKSYGEISVNCDDDLLPGHHDDEFLQGIALRQAGQEYGATTGRPRRVGWLDLPLLRYVLTFNRPDIILTKLDVLDELEIIPICHSYQYQGPDIFWRGREIHHLDQLQVAIPAAEILQYCQPIYTEFPGWKKSLKTCKSFADFPSEFKEILKFVVSETGIQPRIISVGPDRKETIFL